MTENEKANQEIKRIEAELNALIKKCIDATGFIYIRDTISNDWHHRLTEPIKLTAFIPSNFEEEKE